MALEEKNKGQGPSCRRSWCATLPKKNVAKTDVGFVGGRCCHGHRGVNQWLRTRYMTMTMQDVSYFLGVCACFLGLILLVCL